MQIKTNIVNSHIADSKPVKQEVNGTMILPPFRIPWTDIHTDGQTDKALGSIFRYLSAKKLKGFIFLLIKTLPKMVDGPTDLQGI